MRIFFSLRHPGTLRNFASTVRLLEERGHQVHLSFSMQDRLGDGRLLWEVTKDHPAVSVGEVRDKAPWRFWIRFARGARACRDYLRYLTPEYRKAPALTARAEEKTPKSFQAVCRLPLVSSRAGRRLVEWILGRIELAIPSDPFIEDEIAEAKPDVVVVSPLVDFASDQVEVVKSAKALGLRTALAVHSWDNLTNKGLIRLLPDRVFVWNEMQRREAVGMHGVAPAAVTATGAATYDQWFARTPSRAREAFCAEAGLDPSRPFFVYLCSSPFIAPNEAEFIARWIAEVRRTDDPELARAGILIRPHPENRQPWHRLDLDSQDNVSVWPRGGSNPVDGQSKNDYFDSLYHSAAAVGVNTSALIEAGIVGRAVFSVRTPENAATQDGTLHFRHLLDVSGGLLRVADGFEEHRRQLAAGLRETEANARSARAFVRDFVRPHGLEREATPMLADAIEALGRLPRPARWRTPWYLLPLRAALFPIAWLLKVRREFKRVSRKRERALRPVTAGSVLAGVLVAPVSLMTKWRPAKEFLRTHVVPRVAPRVEGDRPTEEMVAVPRLVQKLARATEPILIGPWHGGLRAELLYWTPFLRWVRAQHDFASDQIVVISRGGVGAWYEGIGTSYVDLYDFFTPEQLAARKAEGQLADGSVRAMSEFDREVLKLVQVAIGTRRGSHLHPMQMFRLFAPFWRHQAGFDLVARFTDFQPLAPSAPPPAEWGLPAEYVAVKLGFTDAFPETEANHRFALELVEHLTAHTDVVLLNTGLGVDRGDDPVPAATPRVHRIEALVTPRNNLDVQTRIVSGARLFAGSYGGLAHLAPYYGVRALAFFSDPRALSSRDLEAARLGFDRLPGSLVALDTRDWATARLALGVGESRAAVHGPG